MPILAARLGAGDVTVGLLASVNLVLFLAGIFFGIAMRTRTLLEEEILIQANIEHCSGIFVLAADPNNAASDEKTFTIASMISNLKKERQFDTNAVVELVNKNNYQMMRRANIDRIVTLFRAAKRPERAPRRGSDIS